MDAFVAVVVALICLSMLIAFVVRPKAWLFHIALLSLFSLGYLVLPVLLKSNAGLLGYSEGEIASALGVHAVFLTSLLAGYFFLIRRKPSRPINLPKLNSLIDRYPERVFGVSFLVYLAYFATNDITSYSAGDFEAYFSERSSLASIAAALGVYSQAAMAVAVASVARAGRRRSLITMLGGYLVMLVLLLSAGQRLAVVAPCVMMVIALGVSGFARPAIKTLAATVGVLVLLSPFAVYLREADSGMRGKEKALEVTSGFSYGDSAVASGAYSIAERADLVLNTIVLKEHIDRVGFVGPQFYLSVFLAPIPRFLVNNKPAVLSSDGTPSGEISVLAWQLTKGSSTGSLTAFGGITAYRQGGWLAVVADGLLAGALGALLFHWLGAGGSSARLFYVVLVPLLVVKRVPASFLEGLAEVLPVLWFVAAAFIVNHMLSRSR